MGERVVVPTYVASSINYLKERGYDFNKAYKAVLNPDGWISEAFKEWIKVESNLNIFAEAWMYGHKSEKDIRYRVFLPINAYEHGGKMWANSGMRLGYSRLLQRKETKDVAISLSEDWDDSWTDIFTWDEIAEIDTGFLEFRTAVSDE